jgi:hypothetical protein
VQKAINIDAEQEWFFYFAVTGIYQGNSQRITVIVGLVILQS